MNQTPSSSANIAAKSKVFTEVPADPANGVAAFWKVNVEGFNEVLVTRYQDKKGADVALIGETTEANRSFGQVGFVTLFLTVGTWNYETSDDGKTYRPVTKLDVELVNGEPNPQVNITLNGMFSPKVWSRYTKVA